MRWQGADWRRIQSFWRIGLFLLVGLLVRWRFVAQSAYPLGEGGLFYYVIQYVADHGALPVEIPYYSGGIPFVYPPLGFLSYGAIVRYTSLSLLTVMRWASFLFSSLSLFVFAALARRFLREVAWEFAVLSFATLPSTVWHTAASDSVRNLAFVLLLAGAFFAHGALTEQRGWRWTAAAGLLLGLTALVHPPAALGLGLIVALFTIYYGVEWGGRGLLVGGSIGGLAAIVMLPWFLFLYRSHGPGFVAMLRNGFFSRPHATIWLFSLLKFGPTREPFAHLWAVLGVVGVICAWVAGNGLLALWFLITPLHWSDHIYSLPLALGAGWSIGEVILPWMRARVVHSWRAVAAVLLCALLFYATLGATTPADYREMQPQVTKARLEAWEWMSDHLAADSWVTIVGEDSEWVPAMAQVCSNIPQGAEWTGQFVDYAWMYNALVSVPTYDELLRILRHYRQPIAYLYVSTPPGSGSWDGRDGEWVYHSEGEPLRHRQAFRRSVEQQACVQRVYENEEVVLFDLRACDLSW